MSAFEKVEIGDAVLYRGDCMDVLPTLRTVDAVITDPPYVGMKGGTALSFDTGVKRQPLNRRVKTKTVGDPWAANLDWVPLAERLASKAVFAFCSFHFVAALHDAFSSHRAAALISWYQRNAAPSAANAPQFCTEYCWAFRNDAGLNWRALRTYYDINRLQAGCFATERVIAADGTAAHPTQKPVELMRELMRCGAQTILDPFMGSGTTGVACAQLGRKFIGIEREPKYFDIACKRIEAAYAQGQLFEPETAKPTQTEIAA